MCCGSFELFVRADLSHCRQTQQISRNFDKVQLFAGLQVCRFAGLQVCRFAGLQGCRCAGLQAECIRRRSSPAVLMSQWAVVSPADLFRVASERYVSA